MEKLDDTVEKLDGIVATLDFSPFANLESKHFKELNRTELYNKARFEGAVFDEVSMVESIDVVCSEEKKPWDFDTVFLWKGESTEAGNIELGGLPIHTLMIKRRRVDQFAFEDIKAFKFEEEAKFYEFKDRFIESHDDYIYGIQPLGGSIQNPVMGEVTTSTVETSFDSVWIVGREQQYKLMYNLEIGDYETVMPTGTIETLGSMYPFITKSGDVKYRKGTIKAMLISDATLNRGETSPKDEKRIRRSLMTFLTDSKPKYLKDGSGEQMLISIVGAPTLTPNNDLNGLIYDIDVEFIEVGTTDSKNLIKVGLLEEVRSNGLPR